MYKINKFISSIILLISISIILINCTSIESLIEEEQYSEAEQYCEEIKDIEKQHECYLVIADNYLLIEEYEKAIKYMV